MPSTIIDRIDNVVTSVAVKAPVRLASTGGNLPLSGLPVVDGVQSAIGDRILVKNNTNAIENGIYVAQATAWFRDYDFDGARDAVQGTTVQVLAGATLTATWWNVTTPDPISIGNDPMTFVQTFTSLTPVSLATEAAPGIAEIATQAETNTGTDDQRFVTPLKLAGAISRAGPAAVVSTGSANAYVVTYSPTIGALVTGKVYPWITNFANTAACTVNINGTGAKPIKTIIGADPPSGYIPSGSPILTLYDGTNMVIISAQRTGLIGVVTFNASGTYTKNPAARYVIAKVQGPGGAGGGSVPTGGATVSGGAGGSAGGYAEEYLLNSLLGATEAVTVGTGGAGSSGAVGGNGSGSSSFGTTPFLTATAGQGGGVSAGAAGASGINSFPALPGTGSGGDVNQAGGQGGAGVVYGTAGVLSGIGGASAFGGGAVVPANAAGVAATSPGSGGSGASAGNSIGVTRPGGAGANGVVIIYEYA